MSKTAIVKSGEHYFIKQLSNSQPIKLDRVIFANIEGINSDTDIDLNGSMPTADQIMHTAPVTQSGLLNDKTVVYSVILDTNIGDFTFNYIGLVNAETNTLCMVMHTNLTKKIKTAGQRQGNTITESIWLEIDNASESTGITVNAETWQIDYSKRLAGEDERIRLTNYDLYDRLIIHRGLAITKKGNQLTISPGLAYVAGLRVELRTESTITIENNQSLYIDAWLAGTITGEWITYYNLIVGTNLRDRSDGNFQHYVERIASVDLNGDLTVVNSKSFRDHASTKDWGIVRLNSATNSESETEAATPLAVKNTYDLASKAKEAAEKNANHVTPGRVVLSSDEGRKDETLAATILVVSRVNDRIIDLKNRFEPCATESRVYSNNKKYYLFVRNDGTVAMYDKNNNKIGWSFNDVGTLCEGNVPVERILNLDQFVRDRSVPVGVPVPWPKITPPAGWFECNGAPIDKSKFPRLASAYPSGFLPDLRGEFIRGCDNGRGVDPNRVILSFQQDAIRNIWGTFMATDDNGGIAPTGAFTTIERTGTGSGGSSVECKIQFDASRVVPVSHDNHPRNIAFTYIVKAE